MDIPSVYDHPTTPPSPESTTTATHSTTDQPSTTQPTNSNSPSFVSLDQEIDDLKTTLGGVSASLGGWWAKVQKQSAEALAAANITTQINTARKDLAALNLIEKAKKEVERLGDQAKEGYAVISSEIEKGPDLESNQSRIVNVDGVELPQPSRAIIQSSSSTDDNQPPTSPKGKERALNQNQPTNDPNSNSVSAFDPSNISSFFSNLTKDSESLTASIQSKISQLPHPTQVPSRFTSSGKFDLAQVQKLAEGYLAKGEVYLQDVGKELKEFVQDAVKVIPPSELELANQTESAANNTSTSGAVGVAEKRRMLDLKREAMLSKLRRDESQLLADPRNEDETFKNAFEEFINGVEQAGGLEGEAWKKRIQAELELEESDQSSLKGLVEKLVPSSMTEETFWTRYFFRIHRIDQDEAARRVVLSAAQEDNEGDFSWDMENESEPPSPVVIVKPGKERSVATVAEGVETPKLSKRSQATMDGPSSMTDHPDQVPVEDEWGNSPVEGPEEAVTEPRSFPQPTSSGTAKSGSTSNQDGRPNSTSEPDTNDSFDVVSAQQSADEKPKKSTVVSTDSHQHDDYEDSDWE